MNQHRFERFKGNIYLTGFMASGKSTAGQALAARLEKPFKDLDQVITEHAGKSIPKIFKEDGEQAFREMEWKCLLNLTREFTGVVALGGGALQSQPIVDHLKVSGLMIYIQTPMEQIIKRVYRNDKRPIVFQQDGKRKDKETLFDELKTLYSARKQYYEQAQITMDASAFASNEELVTAIVEKIKQHV